VLRLPESIALEDIVTRVDPRLPREMVPFGLSENTLGPAFVNFAESPHVVAVGRAQSGRTNFVRAMMRSIMARYSPDEATIILIDPRRRSVGVVPDKWLSRYTYALGDIKEVITDRASRWISMSTASNECASYAPVCAKLPKRSPPTRC
jgi:S-DNA-T family DNA segregation ATPase FtsK/SpoIIIE